MRQNAEGSLLACILGWRADTQTGIPASAANSFDSASEGKLCSVQKEPSCDRNIGARASLSFGLCTVSSPSPPTQGETVLQRRKQMDSLTKREQPDRSKINMQQMHEVKYWTHALNVSKEELQKAIDKVGNSAAAVRKELGIIGKEPGG